MIQIVALAAAFALALWFFGVPFVARMTGPSTGAANSVQNQTTAENENSPGLVKQHESPQKEMDTTADGGDKEVNEWAPFFQADTQDQDKK
jgi:hypothetical protein